MNINQITGSIKRTADHIKLSICDAFWNKKSYMKTKAQQDVIKENAAAANKKSKSQKDK